MAKKSHPRKRLRALYRLFKAVGTTILAALKMPSSLSLTENEVNQYYYQNGFMDGMKFFQLCAQNHPETLPYLLGLKGGHTP